MRAGQGSATPHAESAIADKEAAIEELIDALKSDIRYAENKVDFDDDKLKLIGWAGKKNPTPLAIPGQARLPTFFDCASLLSEMIERGWAMRMM